MVAIPGANSHGVVPADFLADPSLSLADYARQVCGKGEQYRGFNLLAGSAHELVYCNNLNNHVEFLKPGSTR